MGILRDMESRSKYEVVTDNTYAALEWMETILIQRYYDSYKIKQAIALYSFRLGNAAVAILFK